MNMILRSAFARTFAALTLFVAVGAAYLFVPPPRHAAAQFADQGTWGGTAGGTANALVITLANVASLNDIVGVPIRFNPAANNTGPVTIVVTNAMGSTTATAALRPSSLGLVAFSLNEFWAGETTSVTYNGSNFVLSSNVDMRPIGSTCEFRGTGAPRGCLIEDGSCVSSSQFAPLASVISTLYGTCSGLQLPDSRGTDFMALDGQGANGLANRITSTSCATPNALGTHCGVQTAALTSTANMPPYTPSGSITNGAITSSTSFEGIGGSQATLFEGSGSSYVVGQILITSTQAASTFTGAAVGSSTPFPSLNPKLLGIRAIKY